MFARGYRHYIACLLQHIRFLDVGALRHQRLQEHATEFLMRYFILAFLAYLAAVILIDTKSPSPFCDAHESLDEVISVVSWGTKPPMDTTFAATAVVPDHIDPKAFNYMNRPPCVEGLGRCQRSGIMIPIDGIEYCHVFGELGAPQDELPNYLDDDCDGSIDEATQ